MLKKASILIVSLLLTACGQAPSASDLAAMNVVASPTPSASPSASPKAAAVTEVYAYADGPKICAALKVWDSETTNIQFPNTPTGSVIYFFSAEKITQNGLLITDLKLLIAVEGVTECWVNISGGKIVSVQ